MNAIHIAPIQNVTLIWTPALSNVAKWIWSDPGHLPPTLALLVSASSIVMLG